MNRRLVSIAAVVVAVIAIVAAVVLWPRGGTPVAHDDAVDEFRTQTSSTLPGTVQDDSAPTDNERVTPAPGAYRFSASGEETVKLAVLPAETRTLAPEVTATIVDHDAPTPDAGTCFEMTVHLFEQHRDASVLCSADGSLSLISHTKHQQIGALSPVASIECDEGVLIAAGSSTHPLRCTMTVKGGPAEVTTELTGTATAGEAESVTVDGQELQAIPIVMEIDAEGTVSGTWIERWWVSETDLLPLRMERELDLSGPASFSEHSTLELISTEPTT